MANGTMSRQEWADWIGAMLQIHLAIDPYLHPSLKRSHDLQMDLISMLPVKPRHSKAADDIVSALDNTELIGGLCYVLSGANLRGGQVIRKTIAPLGFPVNHLKFERDEAAQGDKWLKKLREAVELNQGCIDAFKGALSIMDEIESNSK